MLQETVARNSRKGKVLVLFALLVSGAALWNLPYNSHEEASADFLAAWPGQVQRTSGWKAQCNSYLQSVPITPWSFCANQPALCYAAWSGAQAGCRGSFTCVRAVGLIYGSKGGKTEEAAQIIGAKAGLSHKNIDDMKDASALAAYDGLIVGAPTWNTGAADHLSGTHWDDLIENIRSMSLSGKPVAVFGTGDSVGYGEYFCDDIEELHSAFAEAGAKMLGYTDASGYQHSKSKGQVGDKFLGLPLDQDNESDKTDDRVTKWVEQLKSEGMPLL